MMVRTKIFVKEDTKMLYTEKEKHEIERVKEVFAEHLRQSPDFELLWSDKVGYVWLAIGVNPVYVDTGIRIESAADLCGRCLDDVAMDTVYTNIHTRVTEIGMQRAIGMSAESLYKTFLWEGAYYGIIASVIGSVLGYVCTIFIEAATSDTLQLVAIPVIPILEATLLAVGACLMATAIPLRKISKMSIVDSIETVE